MNTQDWIISQGCLWQSYRLVAGFWQVFSVWSRIGWASHGIKTNNKTKTLSAAIYWNWRRRRRRSVRARSRFCLPVSLMSLAVGGKTIKHCFLCCIPEELQFAKSNLVSEDTHYSKCQPWSERWCSWHLPLKAKGKRIHSPVGETFMMAGLISVVLLVSTLFCNPVTVLPLNIWGLTSGESRMTSRVCCCGGSKISTIVSVKPCLGRRLETPCWCYRKKPQPGESCILHCQSG